MLKNNESMIKARCSGRHLSGFTLFEIMIAVAILVIGLCGIMAIFTASIDWAQQVKADTIMGEGAKSVAAYCAATGTPAAYNTISVVKIPDESMSTSTDRALNGFWYTVTRTIAKSAEDGTTDLTSAGTGDISSELCVLEIHGYLSKAERDAAVTAGDTSQALGIFHARMVYYE